MFDRFYSSPFNSYLMASDTHTLPRVAILDDYQGVALSSADWTPLKGRVSIDVFRDTVLDEDGLVRRLKVVSLDRTHIEVIIDLGWRTMKSSVPCENAPSSSVLYLTGCPNSSRHFTYTCFDGVIV